MQLRSLLLVSIFSSFVFACGGSSGGGGTPSAAEVPKVSYYFDAKNDLPACAGSLLNALAFVNDEKTFYNCSAEGWIEVDVGGSNDYLVVVETVEAGADCENGGKIINTGIDSDGDGELGEDEILNADPVCNGTDGLSGTNGANGTNGQSAQQQLQAVIDLLTPYEASIIDVNCLNGRGTGFKSGGKIVTAYHNVEDEDIEDCWFFSGETLLAIGATSVVQRGDLDIVDITVTLDAFGQALPNLTINSNYVPALGDFLINMSFPLDLYSNVQYTSGFVVSTDVEASLQYAPWLGAFTSDYAAGPGGSGAPVFNSEGEVIGIHAGGFSEDGLELNYVLPFE